MNFLVVSDSIRVTGRSYAEIVAQMAQQKLGEVSAIKRFRKATATRIQTAYGQEIDSSSDEAFVKSLEKAGFLERA